MELSYNTQKEMLILKEYGRNIQKLVAYIKTVEDREQRTQYAKMLIDLMRQINPSTRESTENQNKVWDDLFLMAELELDIESPFPMPEKEILGKKPQKLPYSTHNIRYRHYGYNIELLLKEAAKLEDKEEKLAAFVSVGKLMKNFYVTWNKENVENAVILAHMETMLKQPVDAEIAERIEQDNLLANYSQRDNSKNNTPNKPNHNTNYNNNTANNIPPRRSGNTGGNINPRRNNNNNHYNNSKKRN